MIKFKDEAGNFVTPNKGDYVMAYDIDGEATHNSVREAFGEARIVTGKLPASSLNLIIL